MKILAAVGGVVFVVFQKAIMAIIVTITAMAMLQVGDWLWARLADRIQQGSTWYKSLNIKHWFSVKKEATV